MRTDRRWIFLVLVLASAAAFHFLNLGHYLSLSAIKDSQAELETMRDANPVLTAAIFFACYVAVTALSFPGAAVMTLAAGAIFGLGWGTLIVSFASTLGATLAFLASRWLLGDWVRQRFGSRMDAINAGVAKDGGFYLFTLRLAPVLPFFVINLAMGLTNIRPLKFYWVSQLGMLAGTLVYVNAGTNLARIDSLAGIISPGLIVSLAMLGIFPLLARKLIEQALALRPGDAYIVDSLAWVAFREGKLDEARQLLTQAYASRQDAEIAAHLGEVLWLQNDREGALKLWREAQAQDKANETLKETLQRFGVQP